MWKIIPSQQCCFHLSSSKVKTCKSLFIDEFKEDVKSHKVKFINEKKDREMVLHIENLTKPLCQVFPKRLDLNSFIFNFLRYLPKQYC